MAEQFLFEFSDGGSLDRLAGRVNQFLSEMESARRQLQEGGVSTESFDVFSEDIQARIQRAKANIEQVRAEIERTQQALERSRGPGSRISVAGGADTDRLRVQLAEQQNRLALEELALNQLISAEKQGMAEIAARELALSREKTRAEQQQAELVNRINAARPGGEQFNATIDERRNALLERRRELLDQLVATRARLREELPDNVGNRVLENEQRLATEIKKLREEQSQVEQQIVQTKRQAAALGLQERQAGRAPRTEEEATARAEARASIERELNRLNEEQLRIETQIAEKERDRANNLEQIRALEQRGGAIAGTTEILERIRQVDGALNALEFDEMEELNRLVGTDLNAAFDRLLAKIRQLQNTDVTPDDIRQDQQGFWRDPRGRFVSPERIETFLSGGKAAEVARGWAEVRREADDLFTTLDRAGQAEIPAIFDPQEMLQGFGVLERTILGAFQGLGQRFRATLQFALSGSLIFAGQRLAREFFDSIVDVQRSFADIASSLEFDIEFERGSSAFERELEGIRRQVLQAANDFNVLPTEANAAAFQMVSRFQNVEAAMIATRAQLLATKVATIDQSEALRALTAVAESYGQTIDENVQGQERQIQVAKLYTQALDGAVAIQQAYGIAVEDTIEGSAGLAELLASQGFSLAQTQAAIAQVIQRTGVTGATAADRLGRSLGQLTNPQIRDEILALAAANETLQLTLTDFTDGEEALAAINAELNRIRSFDPGQATDLTNQLAQIIGQRRETAFIAPLLGTAETQREIVELIDGAAGAAETRFSFLEKTVSELLLSIQTRFEQIAQEVERLGLLAPLQLFLTTLDSALGLLNGILRTVGNLVELLNTIRIPILDLGLGDALGQILSLTLAVRTLGSAINLGAFAFNQARGGSIVNLLRGGLGSLFGRGGGGGEAAVGGASLAFRGLLGVLGGTESTAGRAATAIRNFSGGMGLLNATVAAGYAALTRLTAVRVASIAATYQAAAAEGNLSLARALLGRGLAGLLGILTGVGKLLLGLVRFGGTLASFTLAIGGAYAAITGFVRALLTVPSTLFQSQEAIESGTQEERQGERTRIRRESGFELTESEAATQQLRAEIDALDQSIAEDAESIGAAARDFFLTVFEGFLPGLQSEAPQTLVGQRNRRESAQIELIELELSDYLAQLDALGQTTLLGENTAVNLRDARRAVASFERRFTELMEAWGSGEISDVAARAQLDNLFGELGNLEGTISRIVDEIATSIEGTVQTIREAVQRIGQRAQLGEIGPAEAQDLLQVQLETALGLAEFAEGADKEALMDEARNIQLQQLQFFEQEQAFAQELAGLIPDTVASLQAQVAAARGFLERALQEMAGRPELIKRYQLDLLRLEAELAEAIKEQARARLQLQVDNAKTFQQEIDALNALRLAILEQISVEAKKYLDDPTESLPIEEQQALIGIINQIAQVRLRQATLRARLSVLANASSLNNIAAIQANIAAIRAQIQFMRANGEEELLVAEQEVALRDEIASLRQAQADRRAAFFRLTAGTGDDIKAAQAELRAAQDQLQTITDLGGEETQAGYEAELAVLQARQRLAELAIQMADLQRRNASDLTDTLEQAFLDVQEARQQLEAARGPLEKAQAEKDLAEATARAQREFYNRRLADLDFLFDTDQISRDQYVAALRQLQSGVDRTTRQGEEIWREIERQIRSMEEDATDLRFNIPESIRLPTLFEVRRALAADQLGVNYMDNRTQEVTVYVQSVAELDEVMDAIDDAMGEMAQIQYRRTAPGAAGGIVGNF